MGNSIRTRWARIGLSPALLVFMVALAGLPFMAYHGLQAHAEREGLRNARLISNVISTVRGYYSSEVAGRVMSSGGAPVILSEDYHRIPGAIPIPATLSIELGERLRLDELDQGFGMSFLSDAPFASRQRPALDDFQADALRTFRQDPAREEVWRIETQPTGHHVLRLAIPVRMEPTCVYCHNGHPQSPVRNWKVGDIRGIQDVSISHNLTKQSGDAVLFAAYLLFFVGSAVAALREHKKANAQLLQSNDELLLSQSDLKDSEQQLKAKVNELNTLTTVMQKAPFGISFSDPHQPDMPLVYVNDAFELLTGYAASDVLGRNARLLQGPDSHPDAVQRIHDAIDREDTAEIEILNYRQNGEAFWNRFLVFPSHDADGRLLHWVGCHTDITDLKKSEESRQAMEAELQESLKLESLGLTIAGMAHDLNTPIGVAMTACSHLEQTVRRIQNEAETQVVTPESLARWIQGITRSTTLIGNNLNKAATLVRSFKQTTVDASRNEWRMLEVRPFLESLVVSVSPLLKRAHCTVELQCGDAVKLYTEPGSLMQSITNLLVNATIHAFEGRDDRRIRVVVDDMPDGIQLQITDNGKGMDDAVLAKAFSPFFTTRRQAGGSGLGLFSTRRAVEQVLGGRISVSSRQGEGTAFVIWLPRQPASASPFPQTKG